MAILTPDITTSIEKTYTTHQEFGAAMGTSEVWMFVSNAACWIKQGSSAALAGSPATAGSGSMFVPANVVVTLHGRAGADLSVVQDTTGGKASLTRVWRD